MKKQVIYSIIIALSIGLLSACGTDTKENPAKSSGPYSFFDPTTPLVINKPIVDQNGTVSGADYNISVSVLEYGLAYLGGEVVMYPFSSTYGSVLQVSLITGLDGRVTFKYIPPFSKNYEDIRGQKLSIQLAFLNPNPVLIPVVPGSNPLEPNIVIEQEIILEFR